MYFCSALLLKRFIQQLFPMKILRSWWNNCRSLLRGKKKQRLAGGTRDSPTVVLTQYHVKSFYREPFRVVLSEYIDSARRETGNITMEAYFEQGDPSIMWIIEWWDSSTSYTENARSAAAVKVSDMARAGLLSPVEKILLNDLEMITRAISREGTAPANGSITVMLLVEVNKGTEDHFRQINRVVASAFQEHPDVLKFWLSEVAGRKNRFVVYKKFRNRDAFQSHLKDPAVMPVIAFLQTSVTEPPFEKGYHHLIEFG